MNRSCGQDLQREFEDARRAITSNVQALLPQSKRAGAFAPQRAFDFNLSLNCEGLADNFRCSWCWCCAPPPVIAAIRLTPLTSCTERTSRSSSLLDGSASRPTSCRRRPVIVRPQQTCPCRSFLSRPGSQKLTPVRPAAVSPLALEVLGGAMTKSFRRAYNDAMVNGSQEASGNTRQHGAVAASVNEVSVGQRGVLQRRRGVDALSYTAPPCVLLANSVAGPGCCAWPSGSAGVQPTQCHGRGYASLPVSRHAARFQRPPCCRSSCPIPISPLDVPAMAFLRWRRCLRSTVRRGCTYFHATCRFASSTTTAWAQQPGC